MRLEDIHLVHSLAGRIRFKLGGIKGNPDQAREIETRLATVKGMRECAGQLRNGKRCSQAGMTRRFWNRWTFTLPSQRP